jgi:beta-fructofuranosidase
MGRPLLRPGRHHASSRVAGWLVPGDTLVVPWDISRARPFVVEPDIFAATFVQDRAGNWVLVGFVNLEPKGISSFDIIDPIPVTLHDGIVVAQPGYASVGEALPAAKAHARTNA